MQFSTPRYILPVIVIAQFAGTSLWFAGNAVVGSLITELGLSETLVGFITMAVQAGFITGTLLFAIWTIADRFSPVKVFLYCCLLGAASNGLTIFSDTVFSVMSARFATGFFLAGIYPVGMKIASDWHKTGLGKALGYLVGALVVGTALPHLINYLGQDLPWRYVLISTSIIAATGGLLLYLTVPDGPYGAIKGDFKPSVISSLFKSKNFRAAAFGYFGHMWELYTFWAFVPVIIAYYVTTNQISETNISLMSFFVIAIGGIGSVIGGYFSLRWGSKNVASWSLALSGLCCLLLPVVFQVPFWLFMLILFLWGVFVIPDSPQFSTLVAYSSDNRYVATGLTIVNSIGFAITIVSIQLVNWSWAEFQNPYIFWLILAGPVIGLLGISGFRKTL